jgi:hypothetical protein
MSETVLSICQSDELGGKIARFRPPARSHQKRSAPRMIPASNWPIKAGCPMRCIKFTKQPANRNKQQDLSEKDGGSVLCRCGEEKRMR